MGCGPSARSLRMAQQGYYLPAPILQLPFFKGKRETMT